MNRSVVLAWLPVVLILAVIALASGDLASEANVEQTVGERLPSPRVGPESDEVDLVPSLLWVLRKPAHLLMYGALGFFLWRALRRTAPRGGRSLLVATVGIAAVVAALDELNQSFQAGRTGLFTDVLIDVFGAGLAVWLAVRWRAGRER